MIQPHVFVTCKFNISNDVTTSYSASILHVLVLNISFASLDKNGDKMVCLEGYKLLCSLYIADAKLSIFPL